MEVFGTDPDLRLNASQVLERVIHVVDAGIRVVDLRIETLHCVGKRGSLRVASLERVLVVGEGGVYASEVRSDLLEFGRGLIEDLGLGFEFLLNDL